jgi:CheY-like chemotaxis protein
MEVLREKPTGTRLLVVDDQPIVRAGLVTLFQKTGEVEAREAGPKEAANLSLVFRPAVCLLDAALPTLSAFAVA